MRQYNPGIVAYNNINTIEPKTKPKKSVGSGLLAPTKVFKETKEKVIQPAERVSNYVMAIREQRDAYKNGA